MVASRVASRSTWAPTSWVSTAGSSPIGGLGADRSRLRRHCCIRAEGVTDEYQSGGWFHSEGDENGTKRPIVNAV